MPLQVESIRAHIAELRDREGGCARHELQQNLAPSLASPPLRCRRSTQPSAMHPAVAQDDRLLSPKAGQLRRGRP